MNNTVEEILLKEIVPDCFNTDFEAKEYLVHVWDEILKAMTKHASLSAIAFHKWINSQSFHYDYRSETFSRTSDSKNYTHEELFYEWQQLKQPPEQR